MPPPLKKKGICGYEIEAERKNYSRNIRKKLNWTTVGEKKYIRYCVIFVLNVNHSIFALSGQLLSPVAEVGYTRFIEISSGCLNYLRITCEMYKRHQKKRQL